MWNLDKIWANKRSYGLLFWGIFIVAVFLRVNKLGINVLWIDEAYTLLIPRYPIADIIRYMSVDSNPPLFFLLVHFWLKLVGNSLFLVRLLPVLIGLLDLILFYFVIKSLYNKKIAFLSYFILALSSYFIFYSRIIRSFSLLFLWALLVYWFFILIFIKGEKKRIYPVGFIIFSALGIYTHYYFLFFLGALVGGYLILSLINKTYKSWLKLFLYIFYIFLLFSFWLPFFIIKYCEQSSYGHWSSLALNQLDLFAILDIFFIKPIYYYMGTATLIVRLGQFILLLLIIFLFINYYRTNKSEIKQNLVLVYSALAFFVLIIFMIIQGSVMDRYLITSLILYIPILAFIIIKQSVWLKKITIGILVILFAVSYWQIYIGQHYDYLADWSQPVKIINQDGQENDCIFIHEHFAYYPYFYYKDNNLRAIDILPTDIYNSLDNSQDREYYRIKYLGYFDWINRDNYDKVSPYIDKEISSCQRVWLFYQNLGSDPFHLVPYYFTVKFGQPVADYLFDSGIQLKLYNNKDYENSNSPASLQ